MNRGRNIISIDSRYGIGIHSAGEGDAELYDSKAYGELEDNIDCPEGSACDHCFDTRGVILNQACDATHKDAMPKVGLLPLFMKCNSGMHGQATYHDVEFISFKSHLKACGARQMAFGPWHENSDYIAFSEFKNPVFEDVVESAIAFIHDPEEKWKNWEDCGTQFTCTGPYNGVVRVENALFTGSSPSTIPRTFDVVSDNKESVSVQAFKDGTCEFKEDWNSWLCSDDFAVLIFDSEDEDRMDRSSQPIYVIAEDLCNAEGECFNNRLNALMDHCWDGFYTCQERE